ncbi:MAG: gluconate 2-dehydrogenase subunit 3 family protein [bacterium]
MQRRDLLRAFGAATALALLPRDAEAAWARVAAISRPASGLSDAHLALIGSIADVILPRTDSPSATDVRVPAFIDVIVSENYTDDDRAAFITGLDAIEARLRGGDTATGIDAIERLTDRRTEPARTYWRLKSLIIHGYFTSEPVMKGVLKTEIMPGKFDGAAPMPAKRARPAGRGEHEDHSHA